MFSVQVRPQPGQLHLHTEVVSSFILLWQLFYIILILELLAAEWILGMLMNMGHVPFCKQAYKS